jgi:hypothetical protein
MIFLIALAAAFVIGVVCINGPLFATEQHRAMDQSFGPPIFVVLIVFFIFNAGA